MMTVSSERQVSLGVQLRAASTKLQNATAKRKALAQRAAHEAGNDENGAAKKTRTERRKRFLDLFGESFAKRLGEMLRIHVDTF